MILQAYVCGVAVDDLRQFQCSSITIKFASQTFRGETLSSVLLKVLFQHLCLLVLVIISHRFLLSTIELLNSSISCLMFMNAAMSTLMTRIQMLACVPLCKYQQVYSSL